MFLSVLSVLHFEHVCLARCGGVFSFLVYFVFILPSELSWSCDHYFFKHFCSAFSFWHSNHAPATAFNIMPLFFNFFTVIYLCVHTYMRTYPRVYVWRSKDNLPELFLSFHHVGFRDQTQVIGLRTESSYSLGHLEAPPHHQSSCPALSWSVSFFGILVRNYSTDLSSSCLS